MDLIFAAENGHAAVRWLRGEFSSVVYAGSVHNALSHCVPTNRRKKPQRAVST